MSTLSTPYPCVPHSVSTLSTPYPCVPLVKLVCCRPPSFRGQPSLHEEHAARLSTFACMHNPNARTLQPHSVRAHVVCAQITAALRTSAAQPGAVRVARPSMCCRTLLVAIPWRTYRCTYGIITPGVFDAGSSSAARDVQVGVPLQSPRSRPRLRHLNKSAVPALEMSTSRSPFSC